MTHPHCHATVAGLACCIVLTLENTVVSQAAAAEYSDLWGQNGEKWTPPSRLPEVSFAGYQCGEKAIPTPAVTANVKDFGAKGDGTTDDTKAFNDAIAATNSGTILAPAGTYVIRNLVTINKPNVVLRGEGPDKTTLYIPITLTDVKPNPQAGTTMPNGSGPRSWYSYGSGFLNLSGGNNSQSLANITAAAARGDSWITVSTVTGITAGQWVQVQVSDDAAMTLTDYIYGGMISAGLDNGDDKPLRAGGTSFAARVKSVDASGKRVELDRRLEFEIRTAWTPTLKTFAPSVTNSGFESFAIKFPATPYPGHFNELGYNGIQLSGVAHCWVRNVTLINAEGGVFTGGASFNTITNVILTRTPDKAVYAKDKYETAAGATGHHGIFINSADNLVTNFDFQTNYVHDLSVQGFQTHGNVFSNGKGLDVCFDHHGDRDHSNVYTNIDLGDGNRWFLSGGAGGPASGAWETFWNIRSVKNQTYPGKGSYSVAPFGPLSINFVGITTNTPSTKVIDGKWWEAIAPADLVPQNIHEAQLALRLGAAGPATGGNDAGSPDGSVASGSGGASAGTSGGTGGMSGGPGPSGSGASGPLGGSTGATGGIIGTTGGTTGTMGGTAGLGGSISSGGGTGGVGASGAATATGTGGISGCSCGIGAGQGRTRLAGLLFLFGFAWAARRRR
jgi:hypothetical protein